MKEFQTTGYVHLRSLITKNTCEKLVYRMRDLVARFAPENKKNIFDTNSDNHSRDEHFLESAHKISFFFDKNHTNKTIFGSLNKVGHALHHLCPVYQRFSHQEKFYELMKALGHQKPRLLQSMFIFKQPFFGDAVPAHQDATFLYTKPLTTIGLWFALEDADEYNGCLWVLPQGHLGPLKERFVRRSKNLTFVNKQKIRWPHKDFIPLRAKAGDVIALHGLLPHMSEQNRSSKTRFAYTLHFVDALSYYPKDNWLSLNR